MTETVRTGGCQCGAVRFRIKGALGRPSICHCRMCQKQFGSFFGALVTVPKGTYPKQDKDVKVIGYATHIVASCKLPADQVYAMTKAIADNVPALTATSKAVAGLTPQVMAEDIGVPFHPGAARFYKEKGITVASH